MSFTSSFFCRPNSNEIVYSYCFRSKQKIAYKFWRMFNSLNGLYRNEMRNHTRRQTQWHILGVAGFICQSVDRYFAVVSNRTAFIRSRQYENRQILMHNHKFQYLQLFHEASCSELRTSLWNELVLPFRFVLTSSCTFILLCFRGPISHIKYTLIYTEKWKLIK